MATMLARNLSVGVCSLMSSALEQQKNLLLEKVIERLRERLGDAAQRALAEPFVRQYYRGSAPEDLAGRSVLDLYGAALAHWNLALQRVPGAHLVRVYNPRFEEHGWHSEHTAIETVQDDMPFLVDSVRMAVNRAGLTVHLIVHPVIAARRDAEGRLIAVLEQPAPEDDARWESMMHFEVDRQTDAGALAALGAEIERVLHDVRSAVEDWEAMRGRLRASIDALGQDVGAVDDAELAESRAYLVWLDRDHFTFLGCRDYRLARQADGMEALAVVADSGLGILRGAPPGHLSRSFARLPATARALVHHPQLLVLTQADARSTVHRPGYLDYVGIKCFDASGRVSGERRFLGLYTSSAYHARPQEIPVVRNKVRRVMERSGLQGRSHAGKALLNILETLPREELFQATAEELHAAAMAILHLQERQRVRVLLRRDPYGRFLTCLVYLPREGFNTALRQRIQELLCHVFQAHTVDFTVWLSESPLARLYFVIRTDPGTIPEYDATVLEGHVAEETLTWEDVLHASLVQELGEERGNRVYARYCRAFPASYREDYSPPVAVQDLLKIETLQGEHRLGMSLYRPLEEASGVMRFKLFRTTAPIALSQVLPMLENMGVTVLDERPHELRPTAAAPLWIHDFGMQYVPPGGFPAEVRDGFQETFLRIFEGRIENDGFNRLVLAARLSWREVLVLRAYAGYLRQTPFPFSQSYMEQALVEHPQIASLLVTMFAARFDPDHQDQAPQRTESLTHVLQESLDAVPTLDQDRILRRFFELIGATVRTNFYQRTDRGAAKEYLAFKIDSSRVPDLPEPRPRFELYVYALRTEGIHLRGGHVARGGIRWSDRREDFRTEVFDLMKAQMVKNAVIVPVGAKGGFVVKRPPPQREALQEEISACYATFIHALLDLTDNREANRILPPPDVVRYDGDDPYLVVAADRGTATFSDLANAIAKQYRYWLGDAFASGGSMGYDHKKMGITARGAWESVQRHFHEIGLSLQRPFTVIGIGDMSGDVFGNGMLRSRCIRLLGAFDHRHILLDPLPDPERSYCERERLFRLPQGTWEQYDRTLLSEGGGIFPRSAKSIPLSPQVRTVLAIDARAVPPNELIRALLRAPVDLLWNGGIGTFVKAGHQTHAQVGDRANDGVRIDAAELRCKVIAEGGNLGLTQEARVEYARHGGRLNTDFIDNSAGVDTSDHEVNIKILLDEAVQDGELTVRQRNRLLADTTEAVAAQVLANNYLQAQALSLEEREASDLLDEHQGFLRELEKSGRLERLAWQLPDEEGFAARRRAGTGLTRPELAVLLAHGKLDLYRALLASDLCDEPYLAEELADYFPAAFRNRFAERIQRHRLRRELIATQVANRLVNRMGSSFAYRVHAFTGVSVEDLARAYLVADKVFDVAALWSEVTELDGLTDAQYQLDILHQTRRLVDRATRWLLHHRSQPLDVPATIEALHAPVRELGAALPDLLDPGQGAALEARTAGHRAHGVSDTFALRAAALPLLAAALDIAEAAHALERPPPLVARVYFALGARLGLTRLSEQIGALPDREHWARLARAALREELAALHSRMTRHALLFVFGEADAASLISDWADAHRACLNRYLQRINELQAAGRSDMATLEVALSELRRLATEAGGSSGAP